jgi:hypothetical protein
MISARVRDGVRGRRGPCAGRREEAAAGTVGHTRLVNGARAQGKVTPWTTHPIQE